DSSPPAGADAGAGEAAGEPSSRAVRGSSGPAARPCGPGRVGPGAAPPVGAPPVGGTAPAPGGAARPPVPGWPGSGTDTGATPGADGAKPGRCSRAARRSVP